MSPPQQEVKASPSSLKRKKIKNPIKKRQKVIRKVFLKGGEEKDDEDKEDNLPLSQRTCLARSTQLE